ncbi:MAG: TMEM43 family protein, partial [Bradymonadaceae bacterium]
VGGWLLVVIAFSMLFGPLEAAAGAVPLVGGIVEDFVEFGTTIVAGVLGSALALMVVSVGWIVYRPVVGGLLLVGGAALLAGIVYAAMKLSSRETAVG